MTGEPTSRAHDPGLMAAGAANDFLAVYLSDVADGEVRALADYQRMFPGHAAAVAAEYGALMGEPYEEPLPTIPQVEIGEVIGRGGQGTVYRGQQEYLDRPVAVKVLAPAFRHPQFVDRFRREARTLASLAHPNIVTCYQAGVTDDGQCYLVMELVDGPSLRAWLDRNDPLAVPAALRLVHDMASALSHAQASGIVHRDVKPENVLLEPWADAPEPEFPWRPRLADLGLARPQGLASGPTLATPAGAVLGTPTTMAPEQFDAPEKVDHRADIYGLGCVLYHALTGRQAFGNDRMTEIMVKKTASRGPDPRKHVPQLPAALGALVQRMLAGAPEDRPQSYEELTRAVDRIAAASLVAPRRASSRALAITIGLFVVAAAALAFWWPRDPDTDPQNRAPAAITTPDAGTGTSKTVDWQPSRDVDLFAAGEDPFATWQRIGARPGRDENGTPSLNLRRGLGLVTRPLEPGPFRLRGGIEPRGRFRAPEQPPAPVRRAGVRIGLGPDKAIELELLPTASGTDYDATLRWLARAAKPSRPADPWQPGAAIASLANAITEPGGKLSFTMTWRGSELVWEIGTDGAEHRTGRLRPGDDNGLSPSELTIFLEGGLVVLHDMQLRR